CLVEPVCRELPGDGGGRDGPGHRSACLVEPARRELPGDGGGRDGPGRRSVSLAVRAQPERTCVCRVTTLAHRASLFGCGRRLRGRKGTGRHELKQPTRVDEQSRTIAGILVRLWPHAETHRVA